MSQPPAQPSNRLIHETSPYLLQHAHNPVDWYPWGEEAFQTARQRDKPVLLSIGYSACHWCHVMERECFENPRIAELMNRLFVNIKVDREERPDVDALYMNFVQMTTGSGGWPLTVFLAPDQLPFFGGTYFPPDDRYGRPGFPRILETLARAYHERGDELEESRGEILRRLQLAGAWDVQSSAADESVLADAASQSLRHLDPVHGGFGPAPKFPSTMVLGFLLRRHRRAGDDEAMRAVRLSLDEMAKGGIFDHFGGGFHRYSVDERWLVPHFEKMLYDNALLARLYVEAFQCTEYPFYRQVAAETLEWVLREMTDPSGGFYSALDADSEGEEGKFYVWTPQQVDAVLSSEESRLFKDFYDISAGGNFEGSNIPHHRYSLETFADKRGLEPAQLEDTFARCRRQLLDERGKRIRPGLDDKILTAWNGMMLAALAEAGWALKRDDFIEAARRNAAFLDERAVVDGRLRRSWKDGHAKLNAYVEDYACAVEGWLALYAATGEPRWLDLAANMTDQQIELFWDRESGDFYFTSNDHERLLVRNKEFTDNAMPSGNSTSCRNLLLLGTLLEKEDYLEKARTLLSRVGDACRKHPLGFGNWLQALDFLLGPADEIVLVGSQERRSAWEDALRRRFLPNKVIVSGTAGEIRRAADRIPLLEGKADREGAYVCRNSVCRPPVESAQDLLELL